MRIFCTTIKYGVAVDSFDNMPVKFERNLCDQNPYCPAARKCPKGALHIDRKTFRPTFDHEKCTGCAVCVSSCPRGAVHEA